MREKTTDHRKMAIQGFDSVLGSHYFHALLEFQVEELRGQVRRCRRDGRTVSLFACFLRAVGQVLTENPRFNTIADYSQMTSSGQVDIAVPVEIVMGSKVENRQHVIRNVANKSVDEITAELEQVKQDTSQKNGFISSPFLEWALARLPRFLVRFIFKLGLKDHRFVQAVAGTTFVPSVSMFDNTPGFVLPFVGGPKATSFAFGSIYKKPLAIRNEIKICEVVSVTASFNHDIVDGAPAARFINRLRRLIEKDFMEILLGP